MLKIYKFKKTANIVFYLENQNQIDCELNIYKNLNSSPYAHSIVGYNISQYYEKNENKNTIVAFCERIKVYA